MPLLTKIAVTVLLAISVAGYINVTLDIIYDTHSPLYNLVTAFCSFGILILATELIDEYRRF